MKTAMLSMAAAAVAAVGVVLVPAGAARGNSLIRNGGFETLAPGGKAPALPADLQPFYAGAHPCELAGWRFGGGWENGRYSVHVSDQAHTGKQSCEIRCEKKGRGGIASSPFKLRPGSIVEVSLWIKAAGANDGRVFLNFEGTPGDGWNHADLPGGTHDWRNVVKRCVVPVRHERADGQTLVIFIYSKASGSVWIDDVAVRELDVNAMAEAPDTPALTAPKPEVPPAPAGSVGYRVGVADSLEKVLPDTDFAAEPPGVKAGSGPAAAVALARNEHEAVQVVIEAPWRDVKVHEVELSPLAGPSGAVIPATSLSWRRVDCVETTLRPVYPVPRVGLYPDPLMPPGPFTVAAPSRKAVWVSVYAPKTAAAGVYCGTITVRPEGLKPTVVPLTVTIWDFALPDQTHLRTLTWLGTGVIRAFYGYRWSAADNRKFAETVHRYQDILLAHRLGPGGEVAAHINKSRKTGKYDFTGVDASLSRLIGKGMNAFIMGTAPNLRRSGKKEYTPAFLASFGEMLKAYGDHLREKGWLDKAYVYTYDEAPPSAWPEVRKVSKAIRAAAPELKILQCLNQPAGVKALADAVDVFDVYVAQYHKTGVAALQKKGTEVWLAVCCYPMDHPNLFIEYPLIDGRMLPMFCWKYGAAGFEYWSPNAWGANWRAKPPNQWPTIPWNPNTFGRYNGDGYLVYPGPNGVPYPSLRLKALRDGVEDYEMLYLLKGLAARAAKAGKAAALPARSAGSLLTMNGLIRNDGSFSSDAGRYFAFRRKLADTIVELQELLAAK